MISLEPYSLNFVYGPRQVGKTTGVKLLIKRLIQEKVFDPLSIFYLDLDAVVSLKVFRRLIEHIINQKKERGLTKVLVFLDGVTSVQEWWKILKFFIDSGELDDSSITVLGSSTIGLIKAPERFPGRTGKGKVVNVMPLNFAQFATVMGHEKREVLYRPNLATELWERYKWSGGFPKSINQHSDAKDSLISGVLSEVYRHGRDARIAQEILASVLQKIPFL
ncbi:MAG: AAA family ATPase [Conexivisphaerales archaeon]